MDLTLILQSGAKYSKLDCNDQNLRVDDYVDVLCLLRDYLYLRGLTVRIIYYRRNVTFHRHCIVQWCINLLQDV